MNTNYLVRIWDVDEGEAPTIGYLVVDESIPFEQIKSLLEGTDLCASLEVISASIHSKADLINLKNFIKFRF